MNRYASLEERAGRGFALKNEPPRAQPFVVVFDDAADLSKERVLVDPAAIDPSGGTAIDWYVPSRDGRRVAVSLSKGGTEDGTLWVYDADTGKRLADEIPHVNYGTAYGGAAWNADGSGLWYTRYPGEGERAPEDVHFFQEVWFHRIGEPVEKDVRELGPELEDARVAENFLTTSPDGRWVVDSVQKGDGGEWTHWLREPAGGWSKLADYADQVKDVRFGPDGQLYLLSRKDAPRGKILRLSPEKGAIASARSVAAAKGKGGIVAFEVTRGHLYLVEADGGPTRLRVVSLSGAERPEVRLPPVSAVPMVALPDVYALHRFGDDAVAYEVTSFTAPPAWYRLTDGAAPERLPISSSSEVSFADVEVVREFATSRDGTRVPVNILLKKGTRRDGTNPTLLYGYGGYGSSLSPSFRPIVRLWLEQGGVYAVANLRGGAEYGEPWHQAGMLTRKQNVFDDFIACAEHLVARKYTQPAKLAVRGGSNGGLLVGAFVTQRPKLARAAVAQVPIFDMLRFELEANGVFNVPEFGTVKDPGQFRAMLAYSPYQKVEDGVPYPAVLMTAGLNDTRVDPLHARKMAARLQAASSSGRPVLLRVTGGGHGVTSSLAERIAQEADVYGFLFDQLGVSWRGVPVSASHRAPPGSPARATP
jgi:prolyl oligopeptidase